MKFKKTIETILKGAFLTGMLVSSNPSQAEVNKLTKPMASKEFTIDWVGSFNCTFVPDENLKEGDILELRKLSGNDTLRVDIDSDPKDGKMSSSFDYTDISSPDIFFLRYGVVNGNDTSFCEDLEFSINKIHKSAYRYPGDISWVDWTIEGGDTVSTVNSVDIFRPIYYWGESWSTNFGKTNIITNADAYPYNGPDLQVGDKKIDSQDLIPVINAWGTKYIINNEDLPMHAPQSFLKINAGEVPIFTNVDSSYVKNDSIFIPVYADISDSIYSYEFSKLQLGDEFFKIVDILPGDYLKNYSASKSLSKISNFNQLENLLKVQNTTVSFSSMQSNDLMYLKQNSENGFNYLGTLFGRQENIAPNNKKLMTVVGIRKDDKNILKNEVKLFGKYDLIQQEGGLAKKIQSGFIDNSDFLTSMQNEEEIFGGGKDMFCYPNPFNLKLNIKYKVKDKTHINITVYDNLGSKIKTLFNDKNMPGTYKLQWDGKNQNGKIVGSGIYYLFLKTDNNSSSFKVIRLK